jgi:hypothetical protein
MDEVFVPGRPLQPSQMFLGKAYLIEGATEKFST